MKQAGQQTQAGDNARQKMRSLGELIDGLAKGKLLEKILRQ